MSSVGYSSDSWALQPLPTNNTKHVNEPLREKHTYIHRRTHWPYGRALENQVWNPILSGYCHSNHDFCSWVFEPGQPAWKERRTNFFVFALTCLVNEQDPSRRSDLFEWVQFLHPGQLEPWLAYQLPWVDDDDGHGLYQQAQFRWTNVNWLSSSHSP